MVRSIPTRKLCYSAHKRYAINAVCAATFYRVCYYTTSNKATEFVEFLDYLVKFSKMRTGNDVKKLYSDYFSTYMDDTKVTLARTRDGRSIELEVTPPVSYTHLTLPTKRIV